MICKRVSGTGLYLISFLEGWDLVLDTSFPGIRPLAICHFPRDTINVVKRTILTCSAHTVYCKWVKEEEFACKRVAENHLQGSRDIGAVFELLWGWYNNIPTIESFSLETRSRRTSMLESITSDLISESPWFSCELVSELSIYCFSRSGRTASLAARAPKAHFPASTP